MKDVAIVALVLLFIMVMSARLTTKDISYNTGYKQALKDLEAKHPTLFIKAKTENDEIFWIENSNYKRNTNK